jgi:hypothetical protein
MFGISSYKEAINLKDGDSRPAEEEKFVRYHLNVKKVGVVMCACHFSNGRKHEREGSWSKQASSEK